MTSSSSPTPRWKSSAEAVVAALGDLHESRVGVDEVVPRRAGRGLGVGDEPLVVDLRGHVVATDAEEHLRELRAEHELVRVAADVGFEVDRGARAVAALEALGRERERSRVRSRCQTAAFRLACTEVRRAAWQPPAVRLPRRRGGRRLRSSGAAATRSRGAPERRRANREQ